MSCPFLPNRSRFADGRRLDQNGHALGACSVVSGCAWELRRLTLGSGIMQQAI
jgi:hypothetical protein